MNHSFQKKQKEKEEINNFLSEVTKWEESLSPYYQTDPSKVTSTPCKAHDFSHGTVTVSYLLHVIVFKMKRGRSLMEECLKKMEQSDHQEQKIMLGQILSILKMEMERLESIKEELLSLEEARKTEGVLESEFFRNKISLKLRKEEENE